MSAHDPRLAVVAGWDADRMAGAVGVLDGMSGRLPAWRFRLEELGRSLESAEVWSGPAAATAARVVLILSDVTTTVARSFESSLECLERVVREARNAAELAAQARAGAAVAAAAAAAAGPAAGAAAGLGQSAGAGQWEELAELALRHADLAGAAADAAGRALDGLRVRYAFADRTFDELALLTRVAPPPKIPAGASPGGVADWWVALPATGQRDLVRVAPDVVGALDGVPGWARDRANRTLLARALAVPEPSDTARAVADELSRRESRGEMVALYAFDEPGERVALAVGDVDAADAIAVLVPGIATTPDDDLDAVTSDVRRVTAAAAASASGLEVAGIAWLGYRPPRGPGIAFRSRARSAGPALDTALDGLAAARSAARRRAARTTLLAHSYGTVVVDEAADAPGRLAADAVVLLGSPGMEPTGAASLEAPEVYDGASTGDPISRLEWFGPAPWRPSYGAVELPAEMDMGHSDYFDTDRPTLAAMGAVVAGGWVPE